MNIFKKVFCRIFQFCFKVAIPFLLYYNPVILDGISGIISVLNKKNIDSILLVTDKPIRNLGITKNLENLLVQNQINCIVYDEVISNPTIYNVESARELYLKNNCKALIGFGGGSAIDCAKAVGARIAKPKQSIQNMA